MRAELANIRATLGDEIEQANSDRAETKEAVAAARALMAEEACQAVTATPHALSFAVLADLEHSIRALAPLPSTLRAVPVEALATLIGFANWTLQAADSTPDAVGILEAMEWYAKVPAALAALKESKS